MQPVQASEPFSADDYLFEVKWDGLRCLLFADDEGRVRLQNRALEDITEAAPELRKVARQVTPASVFDGELVATDEEGRPDRQLLEDRMRGRAAPAQAPLSYLAFDALFLNRRPQLRQPLRRRKARLKRAVQPGNHLFVPDHIQREGVELYQACLERGLEGVVAKHTASTYVPGQRSPFWLTIDAVMRGDFVVLGSTPGSPFTALLVGAYEDGRLLPCGSLTGGFDDEECCELAAALRRLHQDECPLTPPPQLTAPVDWVRPELVVRVRYSEWSRDGTLRFPIFDGLRHDTHPAECVRIPPRVVPSEPPRPGSPAFGLTRFPF
jgi:bifunctional non-homologous end joining protein LigD